MHVASVAVRDFRSYASATVELGERLTVLHGPNGAGKSNLLEALYCGCTGRSCRTNSDRELVRFGQTAARTAITTDSSGERHELAVVVIPGEAKRMTVDGVVVERLLDSSLRPLVTVFMPDRLELVKGPPMLRRAHLDQVITALWPSRVVTRRMYAQALAQRNAALVRVMHGSSGNALDPWDQQLAVRALELSADRAAAVAALAPVFTELSAGLRLDSRTTIEYRPRSKVASAAQFVAELTQRREADLARGFTGYGPHRDDVVILHEGREIRTYGSQGQQRLALLALLLAERQVIATTRYRAPLILLDDVTSELDTTRRQALLELLHAQPGQALITVTDPEHVPTAHGIDTRWIEVSRSALDCDSSLQVAA